MTPAVTIVVVNFNAGDALRDCLASAAADLDGVTWSAVVVDNASTDDSLSLLPPSPAIEVVRNTVNVGFGAAVNQAARLRRAPLLWLLNPDCVVQPGTVAALWRVMASDASCAVAAPQLLNADGTTQESARGEPTAWTGLFGRHGFLTRFFPGAARAKDNLRARAIVERGVDSAEVDWVMGAAMLIRRDQFDTVGGFDERYFLYWEDADLCRRLRARGASIGYVPGARVDHPGGRSSATARRQSVRAFHRSAYRYFATHTEPRRWHPARGLAWAALTFRGWWRS